MKGYILLMVCLAAIFIVFDVDMWRAVVGSIMLSFTLYFTNETCIQWIAMAPAETVWQNNLCGALMCLGATIMVFTI